MLRSRQVLIATAFSTVATAFTGLADAQVYNKLPENRSERVALERSIRHEQKELKEFQSYIDDLEAAADQSSNSGRRVAIDELQHAMVGLILRVEDRVGKEHAIMQHGKDPRVVKENEGDVGGGYVSPYQSRYIKQEFVSGGTGPKPHLNRLTRMQSTFRVAKSIRQPAIDKHQRGVPAYLERTYEFARLWELEIRVLEATLAAVGEQGDLSSAR